MTPRRIDVSVETVVVDDRAHGRREDVAAAIPRALEQRLAQPQVRPKDTYADRIAAALVRRIGP
jgi:hypothetical protein